MRHGNSGGKGGFRIIEARAKTNASKILHELLPQGREIEGMFVANNPLRLEDAGLNFQVNLSTGSWMDIKAGVLEFGFVPLTAYVRGTDLKDAAAWLEAVCSSAEGRKI